jgi:hypothetical protein
MVLGLIIIYNLHRAKNTVIRDRKRPKSTSINTRITRSVFSDLPRKKLPIPRVINNYNYYINSIDLAN